ncbi:hypothetical protein HA050_21055 [Iodobacter sp. HSC-16F04]|uniref:Acetate uptake transporter n=1 Tax=Iodobacter violaceini TaxID=3044271 RepID=A0ABX0L1P4_9NEIS|nr:acetate uptake transporter [Iodobacter violacea]NHQ88590.1 hypothetical protein [Iodobacter violacea]
MSQTLHTHDQTANPAPLGLLGFGMTTILLNLHNAGVTELSSMILAMGIFYGGIAQVIAGLLEWKKGNTFGTVAFTSYGMFWLSLVALLILPKLGLAEASSINSMTAYLTMWGIFTAFLFVGTLKLNKATQFIFGSLTVLFALLALGDYTANPMIKQLAGIEGIICGASAIYAAMAQILNEMYEKEVMPLG